MESYLVHYIGAQYTVKFPVTVTIHLKSGSIYERDYHVGTTIGRCVNQLIKYAEKFEESEAIKVEVTPL